jgi:hypothetical protein
MLRRTDWLIDLSAQSGVVILQNQQPDSGQPALSDMMTRLDRLEEQANRLKRPIAYASMLYVLRHRIDLVREGLRKHPGEARQ